MDEYHRRNESGRYDHEKKKEPTMLEKLRETLVPGSSKGVKRSQNKSVSDQLSEMEDEDKY